MNRVRTFLFVTYLLGFYDPDGYFFDKDGFDQFGGYYDNDGYYHPGEKNKHEFPDYKQHDQTDRKGNNKNNNGSSKKRNHYEDDDDLIRAFEMGDEVNDYHEEDDHKIKKYLQEFKNVEEVIDVGEEEG